MSKIKTLLIFNPEAGEPAAVSDPMGMGGGYLIAASGNATGANIAEVMAMCEGVANQNSPGTLTPEQVKVGGKTVAGWGGGAWSGSMIPGAQCHPSDVSRQWNVLHVVTYYYGYPAPAPTRETVTFRGVAGTFRLLPAHPSTLAQRVGLGSPLGEKIEDLIDAWWERDVAASRPPLREPVDRDGAWMLYKNLPVNSPLGADLGLEGQPLRATSVSVAVANVEVRRSSMLFPEPNAHVNSPYGTGQTAINRGGIVWRFEGCPTFGVILSQDRDVSFHAVTQAIMSSSRESPTNVFTNLSRPIRILVNSPKTEDWMNDGHLDLWVRVNSR